MTREESWHVEGVTLTLLRRVAALGFTVSVFRFPSSLLGTMAGVRRDARALDRADPPTSLPKGLIEEVGPGEWRLSDKGRRRFKA